jgi:acyl carrier protein
VLCEQDELRLKQTMAGTFDVDVEEIEDRSSPETIPAWRSLNHLALMTTVEEEFGITFSMEDMTRTSTYAALRQVVAAHLS